MFPPAGRRPRQRARYRGYTVGCHLVAPADAEGMLQDDRRRALVDRTWSLLRPLGMTITITETEAAVNWAEPLQQSLGGGVYAL